MLRDRAAAEAIYDTLDAFPKIGVKPEKIVHVVRPARWLSKRLIRQEIPNRDNTHWTEEPEPHNGWLLNGVVEVVDTSVSGERSNLLLLDDGRCMAPSYHNQWADTDNGLIVPADNLRPLDENTPVNFRLAQNRLDYLAWEARHQ